MPGGHLAGAQLPERCARSTTVVLSPWSVRAERLVKNQGVEGVPGKRLVPPLPANLEDLAVEAEAWGPPGRQGGPMASAPPNPRGAGLSAAQGSAAWRLRARLRQPQL